MAERNAFLDGYAQGERAGADAASKRSEATLRALTSAIDDLVKLRTDIIQRTERQMVQLALSIARRIVGREISLDRSLIVAMARVAVERLGSHASATVRLHPDDYAAIAAALSHHTDSPHVQVVADPAVQRGGCLVDSDFGFMDVSPDAQFDELARRLLEDPAPPDLRLESHVR
jgi:flagellar assembly protein FliH